MRLSPASVPPVGPAVRSPSRPSPPPRRWLPAAGVLAVVLAVVFGGYVVAAALSEPAGRPIMIAGRVRIEPLSGWSLAQRFDGALGVRFTRGSGNLDVRVLAPFPEDAVALAERYVAEALDPQAERLSISDGFESVELASGLAGVRMFYVGVFDGVQTPIEGEVTAVVSPGGTGVLFDGWAPEGLLQYADDDIDEMIDTTEVA